MGCCFATNKSKEKITHPDRPEELPRPLEKPESGVNPSPKPLNPKPFEETPIVKPNEREPRIQVLKPNPPKLNPQLEEPPHPEKPKVDFSPNLKPSKPKPVEEPPPSKKPNEVEKDINRDLKNVKKEHTDETRKPTNLNSSNGNTITQFVGAGIPTKASSDSVMGYSDPYGLASKERNNGNTGRSVGFPSQTPNGYENAKISEAYTQKAREPKTKQPSNKASTERSNPDSVRDNNRTSETPAAGYVNAEESRTSKFTDTKNSDSDEKPRRQVYKYDEKQNFPKPITDKTLGVVDFFHEVL